jgi:hypothetical protein
MNNLNYASPEQKRFAAVFGESFVIFQVLTA